MPALSRRRSSQEGLNAWPGYVDALSTLLMVIIFVLLVFVLAQAFLSVALSGRDRALDRLHRQIAELSDMLSLERGRTTDLRASVAQLTRDLQSATAARDALTQQLGTLRTSAEQAAQDRDSLKGERDKLAAQLADAQLQAQSAAARTHQLEAQVAEGASRNDTANQQAATLGGQLADAQRQLAAAQDQLKQMRAQIAELDRTVSADKDTIQARLSDLAKLNQQVQALTTLRDNLQRQVQDAAAQAASERQRREATETTLAEERKSSSQQSAALNAQLADAQRQLADAQDQLKQMRAQIAELDRTVSTDKDTIQARLSDLAKLNQQVQALTALRDDLQRQAQDASTRATAEQQRREAVESQLADEKKSSSQQSAALNAQLADAQRQLAAAQDQLKQMRAQIAELDRTVSTNKDTIQARLSDLAKLNQQVKELTALRDDLQRQVQDATARAGTEQQRREAVESQLADERKSSSQQSAMLNAQLADAQRQLADAQDQLKQMRAQMTALDRTVSADKDTIQARLSDLARLNQQVQALTALRDELEQQAQNAAGRATTEQQRREAVESQLADEKKFSDSARAQIALLNQQVEQLRAQMQQVANALDISEKAGRDKDAQIVELGKKLNTALAAKVEELQRYRSEFFGRLREVLQNRPGIQIVGDRFVFQSEVLFPVGSAELTGSGSEQIDKLASTLNNIAAEIPPDLPWILRVDGHADKQPITGGAFASNWELSTQRAVNVVKLLIKDGIPPKHLAATGFSDFQPLATGNTPEDYAKNRRIELRLTDR